MISQSSFAQFAPDGSLTMWIRVGIVVCVLARAVQLFWRRTEGREEKGCKEGCEEGRQEGREEEEKEVARQGRAASGCGGRPRAPRHRPGARVADPGGSGSRPTP